MQTGMSGNTLMYTLAPLIILSFLLRTSSAATSCLALNRTPFPLIRIPHSPKASVVPLIEPPVGIGMRPLCRLTLTAFLGPSWLACLTKTCAGRVHRRAVDCRLGNIKRYNVFVSIYVTALSLAPACSLPSPLVMSTTPDRKRAHEGNGDATPSKKQKRSVHLVPFTFIFPRSLHRLIPQ
jgi:hypothetical protein